MLEMKKFVMMILPFVALTISAQGIKNGSKWNIDNLEYEANVHPDKTITFTAMAEGEELAFRLTPSTSKKNEFALTEDSNADGFNPFEKTPRAKYIEQSGQKLLCLYDENGLLHNVLDGSFFGDGEKVAMGKWMQQIMGQYVMNDGTQVNIGYEQMNVDGVICPYSNISFNGCVTGVISVKGGSRFEGMHEVVQTLDGVILYEVEQDEYGLFKRLNHKDVLKWVNNEPRFGYASYILLNDKQFRMMKKSTLRIMRNAILGKHGYMFSSPDLQEYFAGQPWFSPRPSNDDIDTSLTLVEKLNIELIKAEENNPDHNNYVKEP